MKRANGGNMFKVIVTIICAVFVLTAFKKLCVDGYQLTWVGALMVISGLGIVIGMILNSKD